MTAADRRRRVADDTRRTVGLMVAVIAQARRAGAPVPVEVAGSVGAWRAWADRLGAWADSDT